MRRRLALKVEGLVRVSKHAKRQPRVVTLAFDGKFVGSLYEREGPLLELELIQTQMTQKPMLRAEVYARALRASQNRKEDSL